MAEHKITPRSYLLVFVALLVLTFTTLGLDLIDLGPWHAAVGLAIAATKAMLVILFFMHVWYSTRLTWLVALGGLAWVAILFGLTLTDFLTRDWSTY